MVSTPQYRSKNDPYNGVEEADIRPSYIARQLSEAEQDSLKNQSNNNISLSDRLADSLRKSEQDQPRNQRSRSLQSENPRDGFKNSVSGRQNQGKRSNLKGRAGGGGFKRFAPVTAITGLIIGGGGLFYGASSLLGPNLSALYTKATDVQFSSYHLRNVRMFKFLMDGGDQIRISNFTKRYTTFSPYMQRRLAKNGIEIGRVDADGTFHSQLVSTGSTVLKYGDDIITANDFQTKFAADPNFRDAYTKAKRGRVGNFFDAAADRFYRKTGNTRNIFDNFKQTNDVEQDTERFHEVVSDRVTGVDSKINTVRKEHNDETDEDELFHNGDDVDTTKIDGDAQSKARSMVNSIAGKVSTVGVPVCTGLRIANLVAITASAMQIYQAIAYFHSLIESIDKAKAGEGAESGVNQTLNFLTTVTTSQVDVTDDDGTTHTETVTGSPLEAAGAKLILGNTKISPNETRSYSIDDITKSANRIAVSTGVTNTVCDGVMAASAIVSLASLAVPGGALAKVVVGAVMQTVGGIAMTAAVSAIVNAIVPRLARLFITDLFKQKTGIEAGHLFTIGAANSNSKLATNGSAYMPASGQSVDEQNKQTVVALAEEAAIDRHGRSPFDTSSTNTFLGSLLSQFTFAAYSKNPTTILSSIKNIFAKSVTSLTPASHAASQDLLYTAQNQPCTYMEGAVCDVYGNPIVAKDYSTLDLQPDDPYYEWIISQNLEADGETIKDNSELAKFINFCVNRESPWGVQDANILNALQTDGGIILNNLPIVNDVLDVINAAENWANRDWATGANCLNSADNPRWDNEMKYYQAYVEDMRILGSMEEDNGKSNPVIAYEERYETTHPVDTSYEGTLARITGQTKEDIAFLLEYLEYSDYIANYDYSSRTVLGNAKTEEQPQINLENHDEAQPQNIAIKLIYAPVFATDRRNYTL